MKVLSIFNLARTGKMKHRLVQGHSFLGAPAAKTAFGSDDRSVVQDEASFRHRERAKLLLKVDRCQKFLFSSSSQRSVLLPVVLELICLTLELAGTVLLLVAVHSRIPCPRFA